MHDLLMLRPSCLRRSYFPGDAGIMRISCPGFLSVSPKALLALPPRANDAQHHIPDDVLFEITTYLSPKDILSLVLISRHAHAMFIGRLYTSVELKSNEHCRVTLAMLVDNPHLSSYIRSLSIQPNLQTAMTLERPLDEVWVANRIEMMAPGLKLLESFSWNGLESPESIWSTLKTSCPRLRNIACSVGKKRLKPQSHLFDFDNLLSFSLTLQKGRFSSHLHTFPILTRLPDRLWQMLVLRCPHLTELTIDVSYRWARLCDLEPLIRGRWPHLRRLSVGCIPTNESGHRHPLMPFLAAHPTLEVLSVPVDTYFLKQIVLDNTALPQLRTYTGYWTTIHGLPHRHLLTTLCIASNACSGKSLFEVCNALTLLTSLQSLSIWLRFESGDVRWVYFLFAACASITDLNIISNSRFVTTKLSFIFQILPSLKSLSLTKIPKLMGEDMTCTATELICRNAGIENLSLRFVRPWNFPHQIRPREVGRYSVVSRDEHGSPATMDVSESGVNKLGKRFTRSYVFELPEERGLESWV